MQKKGRPCKKEGELPPSIQNMDKLSQMRYVLASKERHIKRLEMENELMFTERNSHLWKKEKKIRVNTCDTWRKCRHLIEAGGEKLIFDEAYKKTPC